MEFEVEGPGVWAFEKCIVVVSSNAVNCFTGFAEK